MAEQPEEGICDRSWCFCAGGAEGWRQILDLWRLGGRNIHGTRGPLADCARLAIQELARWCRVQGKWTLHLWYQCLHTALYILLLDGSAPAGIACSAVLMHRGSTYQYSAGDILALCLYLLSEKAGSGQLQRPACKASRTTEIHRVHCMANASAAHLTSDGEGGTMLPVVLHI